MIDGKAVIPDVVVVIDRFVKVLAAVHAAGTLMFHLQNDRTPGTLDEPGTPGWLILRWRQSPGEFVLLKAQDNGFEGAEFENDLAHAGVIRVAVAGLLSETCINATIRDSLARSLHVILIHDAHATYNLDDIPSSVVSRVTEHALGDEVELAAWVSVMFSRLKKHRNKRGFGIL